MRYVTCRDCQLITKCFTGVSVNDTMFDEKRHCSKFSIRKIIPETDLGVKHDAGKPRYSLIYWPFITGIARVLTYGALKYKEHNWKYVENAEERYKDAVIRHLMDADGLDPESGEDHLLHSACNIMFLYWFRTQKKE